MKTNALPLIARSISASHAGQGLLRGVRYPADGPDVQLLQLAAGEPVIAWERL